MSCRVIRTSQAKAIACAKARGKIEILKKFKVVFMNRAPYGKEKSRRKDRKCEQRREYRALSSDIGSEVWILS